MIRILMYVSSMFLIIPYIIYNLLIQLNKNKKISNDNSFNITKDIISEYNSINIIENSGIFTYYNLKRGVIRLNTNTYYSNSLSSIAISLLEAGISVVDKNNNKFLNVFKIIFANIKWVYLFPILSLVVNIMSYTIADAKIGIIIVLCFSVIEYLFINVLVGAYDWLNGRISKIKLLTKDNKKDVLKYIQKIIYLNKIIFISELLVIIRMVAIIFN